MFVVGASLADRPVHPFQVTLPSLFVVGAFLADRHPCTVDFLVFTGDVLATGTLSHTACISVLSTYSWPELVARGGALPEALCPC